MSTDLRPDLHLIDEALDSLGRREREALADRSTIDAALILEVRGHGLIVPPRP